MEAVSFKKVLLAAALLPLAALAQPQLTPSAPVVPSGTPAVLTYTMAGGGMNPAAFQADIPVPTGATVAPSPGLAAAGKQLWTLIQGGVLRVLVAGGLATVPDGPVLTVGFTSASFNFVPVPASPLAVDYNSVPVTFTVPPLNYVAPASPCDLNGDGVINQTDVALAADQAVGKTACTNGDLNGDGKCNAGDVQRVVKAANGGACVTK